MIQITHHRRKKRTKYYFECKKCGCCWNAEKDDGIVPQSDDYYDNLTGTMNCPECESKTSGTAWGN